MPLKKTFTVQQLICIRVMDDFEKEKACLELLSELKNPNVVPLLCSYSIRDRHYLIFPRAEMDLAEFLRHQERPTAFVDDTTFFKALQGLASALDAVHNLTLTDKFDGSTLSRIGYHHDIRPANILVTNDQFLLADFGLSKFKDPYEENSETEWKCGKGDYIAPECYGQGFKHDRGGRAIDIWALGCMIVDIAAYMEDGYDGLNAFRASRHSEFRPRVKNGFFFHDDHIKEEVSNQMKDLQQRPRKAGLRHLLLSTSEMLRMIPSERSKSSRVHSDLTRACTTALYEGCHEEVDKFLMAAETREAIDFLTYVHFQLIRLSSWADMLGLSANRVHSPDPTEPMRSNVELEIESMTGIQERLTILIKSFRKWNAYMDDGNGQDTDAQNIVAMENDMRRTNAEHLDHLFTFIPKALRKEADRRARRHVQGNVDPHMSSYNLLERTSQGEERLGPPEIDSTAPTSSAASAPGMENGSDTRWHVWDDKIGEAVPTTLVPKCRTGSDANDVGRRVKRHPPSIIECIGFDPKRSIKAMNPGTPIEDIV